MSAMQVFSSLQRRAKWHGLSFDLFQRDVHGSFED